MSDQLAQTIGQNVRCDSLVGFQEFLVAPESPQHHVADDQQRPAIAQNLHRSIQRTPRPPLRARLPCPHISTLAFLTCIMQVTCCRLSSPKAAILGRKLKLEDGNEPSNNEEIACDAIGSAPD